MWKPAVGFVLLLTMLNVSAGSAPAMSGQDAPYRLGAGDEVRIKMFDWRSAVSEIHEWTALNATFSVGPDGNLSLPLIGFVRASGDTLEELANAIAQRLQQTVGLTARPQASVEVTKYRPFYILGSVTRPGAYPYAPGMTILRAVSIAGGLLRITDPSLLTFQQGTQSTAGELRVLMLEYAGLLARRARLESELSGASQITFPPEITQREKDPMVARLLQRERTIFTARRAALQSQIEAQQHLKELLNQEVSWLKLKAQKMDEELLLLKQEVANATSLVSKGLAVSPSEVSARQIELEAEGRRLDLDLDTALLRARQEIERADQAVTELQDKLRTETSMELSQVEEKLALIAARIKTHGTILTQNGTDADVMKVLAEQTGKPSYTITRRHNTAMQQIVAEASTEVEPDDTIEVKRTGALPEVAVINPKTVLQLVEPDSIPAPAAGSSEIEDQKSQKQVVNAASSQAPKPSQPAEPDSVVRGTLQSLAEGAHETGSATQREAGAPQRSNTGQVNTIPQSTDQATAPRDPTHEPTPPVTQSLSAIPKGSAETAPHLDAGQPLEAAPKGKAKATATASTRNMSAALPSRAHAAERREASTPRRDAGSRRYIRRRTPAKYP